MSKFLSTPRGRAVAAVATVSAALVLAACGGGNDDVAPTPAPGPAVAVPASATTSVAGLIAYLKVLVAIQDDTLLPIDISGIASLPVDDAALPTPLT